jgi:hypothetical protein
MTVNVGPLAPSINDVPTNPLPNGLGYNPRCLRRDVNKYAAAVTTANYTYDLIVNNPSLDRFQTVMQGEFALGKWGVHTGGHFTIGGDPGGVRILSIILFSSPFLSTFSFLTYDSRIFSLPQVTRRSIFIME